MTDKSLNGYFNFELSSSINNANMTSLQRLVDLYKDSFANLKTISPSIQNLALAQMYVNKNPSMFIIKAEKRGMTIDELVKHCSEINSDDKSDNQQCLYFLYNLLLLRVYSKKSSPSFLVRISSIPLTFEKEWTFKPVVYIKLFLSRLTRFFNLRWTDKFLGNSEQLQNLLNNKALTYVGSETSGNLSQMYSVISFGGHNFNITNHGTQTTSVEEVRTLNHLFNTLMAVLTNDESVKDRFGLFKNSLKELSALETTMCVPNSSVDIKNSSNFVKSFIENKGKIYFDSQLFKQMIGHLNACSKFIENLINLNIDSDLVDIQSPSERYNSSFLNLCAIQNYKRGNIYTANVLLRKIISVKVNSAVTKKDEENPIATELTKINYMQLVPSYIYNMALSDISLGNYQNSIQLFQSVTHTHTFSFRYWYWLGVCHFKLVMKKLNSCKILQDGLSSLGSSLQSIPVNSDISINMISRVPPIIPSLAQNENPKLSSDALLEIEQAIQSFETSHKIIKKYYWRQLIDKKMNVSKIKLKEFKKQKNRSAEYTLYISSMDYLAFLYSMTEQWNSLERICSEVLSNDLASLETKVKFNIHYQRLVRMSSSHRHKTVPLQSDVLGKTSTLINIYSISERECFSQITSDTLNELMDIYDKFKSRQQFDITKQLREMINKHPTVSSKHLVNYFEKIRLLYLIQNMPNEARRVINNNENL